MFPTRARRFLRRSLLAAATLSLSILSSGAPRLRADDAAILVAPRELHAGGRSAITLTTLDHETRMPIDRSAIVRLLRGDDVIATLLDGADTGPSGRLHVPFDVPNVESGSVTVEAQVAGVEEPLRVAATLSRTPAVLIETDKPIYRPSQTILGRVLLVDNALRPAVGEVELSIHDARGIRVHRESLTAGEFGVAPFSLDLASEVNFGVWKIRVRSEGVESVRDVRVEEYTLPRFDLSVGFERMWALVDQEITGSVNARFFFGKDVDGDVRITAQRWVGVWEEYAATGGALSGGMLEFTLPAAGFVAGTPTSGGQGSVRVDVSVTDSTGTTQAVTEMLTIVNAPVVVGLIPDTDTLKPGLAATVLVTAKSPDGQPLDQVVRVATTYSGRWGESLGTVRQDVDVMGGVGVLVLEPPQETSYARLTATAERDGRKTTTEIRIGSAYSSAGSFLSLTRLGADAPVRIGDPVQFSAVSTDPGTVFFEVYAGGRTVLSDASEADTFTVTVTPEMMPKAKVVAYKINPFNEVVADTVAVEVEPAGSIAVSASFASDEVKPGEEVELVIDAGTGHRTMIGLSVVDQSVLALGRARLHLAEVFGELERRFLEPQVEVHEGGGGAPEVDVGLLAPDRFFGPPRNFGALDTLRQVGLDIAASSNIRIPEGGVLDWAVLEDVDAVPPRAGEKLADAGDVRVRQYFPETWVWEPMLLTDDNGFATMTLTAPDSITGWKLNAVGSSSAGIGFGDGELIVFQDFFVEPTLPPAVTRGEEFAMKVDVFNYLDAVQSVQLTLGGGEWYELLG